MSLSKALDIHIVIADIEEFSKISFMMLFSLMFGYAYCTSYENFKPNMEGKRKVNLVPSFINKLLKRPDFNEGMLPARMNAATTNFRVPESSGSPPDYWLPDEKLFLTSDEVKNKDKQD
jgi:hypothetical protein